MDETPARARPPLTIRRACAVTWRCGFTRLERCLAIGRDAVLRVLVDGGLHMNKADIAEIDGMLVDYRDALKNTSRALLHVEASVWALAQSYAVSFLSIERIVNWT